MRLTTRVLAAALASLALATPAHALNWNAERMRDPFTDAESCRVVPGGDFSRGLTGMSRIGAYYFFFERRGEEVRAGITSDHGLPISGEVQVRAGDRPMVVITAADTPLDTTAYRVRPLDVPGIAPETAAQIAAMQNAAIATASPYRVLTGDRARALIADVLAQERTIWRAVGVNAATTSTGHLEPTASLRRALRECGVVE